MLRNYFTIALRQIRRNKVFAAIHVFGLATALAFCMLIFLFVQDDLSFDRFHTNADRIYRVHKTRLMDRASREDDKKRFFSTFKQAQQNKLVRLPVPLAEALKNEIPQVKNAIRVAENNQLVSNGTQTFEETILWADPDFFSVFSFPLRQGTSGKVLRPSTIVITEKMARKYFGNTNPIGKTLTFKRLDEPSEAYQITGVAADVPANSSIQFDIVAPFVQSYHYREGKDVPRNFYAVYTYIEVAENASLATLKQNLRNFTAKYWAEDITEYYKDKKTGRKTPIYELGITNAGEWHFDTSVVFPKVTNPLYAYILSGLAVLILLIACINYISLALANAAARLREISVRKVIGASRGQLAVQLYTEAQLLVLLALGVGVLLATVFLPFFNEFTDKTLFFNWTQQPGLVWCALGLTLAVGLVAGGYPALVLSGFQVTSMLKGNRTYRFSPAFSNALVFVQYSLCLFLLTCAVVMQRQMNYIAKKDLGYNKEQVLVLNNYTTNSEKTVTLLQRFKDIAARNLDIADVSGTSFSFGQSDGVYQFYFTIHKENTMVQVYNADADYMPTMGIKLLAGRNFSENWRADTNNVIVNETLANMLGGADKILNRRSEELNRFGEINIIGVVKDFHTSTLQEKVWPVMFSADLRQAGRFLVKVKPGHIPETIDFVQKTWKQLAPGQPFDFSFMDEDVAAWYITYQRWTKIIATATIFAIFMACLGLFGLSGLNAANRTKEIGIRKVLGASISQIFVLLNRKTVVLAALAFVVAFPVANYLMSRWLEDFVYRIDISWEVFAVAGLAGVTAALLAVSFYSLRAATENPVKALRSE